MDGAITGTDAMRARFDAQRQAFSFGAVPSVEKRQEALARLIRLIRAYQDKIVVAIDDDFGVRSANETRFSEVATAIAACEYMAKNLPGWAKDRTFFKPLSTVPGKTSIAHVPKGVVGIIAPWNYPFQLAVIPVATALAAGNRVLLKPSELTPKTSALLTEMFAEGFDETEVSVVTGGPEIGEAFSKLAFDHLFYTGSTKVGRLVAIEAAKNLTPVTLELGGKSPCVMMPDADPDNDTPLVAMGKWFNAGQTCIAPDYLLVPKGKAAAYAGALLAQVSSFYDDPGTSADYSSIVSDGHRDRLLGLIADAEARGATVRQAPMDQAGLAAGKIAPTVLWDVPPDADIMEEEIFGPLLPIIEYDDIDHAVAFINERDHPLALYVFGQDVDAAERVLSRTTSGGAVINATTLQFAAEHLPFGGVGHSGYGTYHGEAGFLEFSHQRSVLVFPKVEILKKLMTPPYGKAFQFLTNKTIGK